MRSNRPRDTTPEVLLRSALHRAGLRFYKHRRPIPGLRCEPDVVFLAVPQSVEELVRREQRGVAVLFAVSEEFLGRAGEQQPVEGFLTLQRGAVQSRFVFRGERGDRLRRSVGIPEFVG